MLTSLQQLRSLAVFCISVLQKLVKACYSVHVNGQEVFNYMYMYSKDAYTAVCYFFSVVF